MVTKDAIVAEIEKVSDDRLEALFEVVKEFSNPTMRPGILARLQRITIDGPEDLAKNHELYANGEKPLAPLC